MSLSLKILLYKGEHLTEAKSVIFQDGKGTIGRSDDNTLVLPDPEKFVSRHHASIHYKNGVYYLTDSSLSGVFIGNEASPLNNDSISLDNGTRLKIGEYEIEVLIAEETGQDNFSFPDIFAEPPAKSVEPEELITPLIDAESNRLLGDSDSPFPRHEELIDAKAIDMHEFESSLQDHASPLFDSFIAPQIEETSPKLSEEIPENFTFEDLFADTDTPTADGLIPDDSDDSGSTLYGSDFTPSGLPDESGQSFDGLSNSPNEVVDSPQSEILKRFPLSESGFSLETPTVPPAQDGQTTQSLSDIELFDVFLRGAGIDRSNCVTDNPMEAMQRIGKMFRQLVAGTVSVLRSRAEFKSLFRVNVTVIRAANNNPLKFAVSTDEVLRQLIQNKEGGFLESVESIEQGFSDIMNHQLAMQAGIQASLTDLLKRFDPKTIEKQFEQGIVLQKKAKCWDSYQETYRIESEEAVENFFGDAFVEAYEEQMKVLTAVRNKNEKFSL